MNIIVTGSEGFIGKHLVKYLKSINNINVYCIDRKIGIEADSIDYLLATEKIDVIIHLAAQTSVFNNDIDAIEKDNIRTFIHVCNLANQYGIKFIYASSSTAKDGNTTSMYGLSKRFNEEYAMLYNANSVGVRLHNVYDESNPREGTLAWHILNDKDLILYNNGNNIRHFTHVSKAVIGLYKAIFETDKLVNCVNPEEMTIKEFTDFILLKYGINKTYTCVNTIREKDNVIQEVDLSLKNLFE